MKFHICFLMLLCIAGGVVAQPWTISDSYIRAMPPGQSVTAAFLVLSNHSGRECKLNGVTSTVAARGEFHRSLNEDGMMKMRPVGQLTIAPDEELKFEPGALHIMLFDVQENLKAGSEYAMKITSENCPDIDLNIPVRGPDQIAGAIQ